MGGEEDISIVPPISISLNRYTREAYHRACTHMDVYHYTHTMDAGNLPRLPLQRQRLQRASGRKKIWTVDRRKKTMVCFGRLVFASPHCFRCCVLLLCFRNRNGRLNDEDCLAGWRGWNPPRLHRRESIMFAVWKRKGDQPTVGILLCCDVKQQRNGNGGVSATGLGGESDQDQTKLSLHSTRLGPKQHHTSFSPLKGVDMRKIPLMSGSSQG